MRLLILTLSLITLTGCTVTRQAHVSEVDAATGIVRLVYDQAFCSMPVPIVMSVAGSPIAHASRQAIPTLSPLVSQ